MGMIQVPTLDGSAVFVEPSFIRSIRSIGKIAPAEGPAVDASELVMAGVKEEAIQCKGTPEEVARKIARAKPVF